MFVKSDQVEAFSRAVQHFENHENGPLSFVVNADDEGGIRFFSPWFSVNIPAEREVNCAVNEE